MAESVADNEGLYTGNGTTDAMYSYSRVKLAFNPAEVHIV